MECRRNRVSVLFVRALAVAMLLGLAPGIHAEDRSCSNASLNGSYGFYRTGTTGSGPLAAVGIISFDGKGNADTTQSISRNGDFSFDVEFPSLYEVAPNCTAKGFTTEGLEFARIVIVDRGNGFYILSESSGNAVYGVGTKIIKN